MEPNRPPTDDARTEELLRRSRPVPDPRFVHGLERKLFHKRRLLPNLRLRSPVVAGGAAAVGLASLLATVSLVGAGPFSTGDEKNARAGDDCRVVTVQRRTREPYLARANSGRLDIRFRKRVVSRRVTRCR
jgi:hypothetical protein